MNYCSKIRYAIYKSDGGTFECMFDRLLGSIPSGQSVLRLVLFGSPEDNVCYEEQLLLADKMVGDKFGGRLPVFSYVAQPPLDCDMAIEVHGYCPDEDDMLEYKSYGNDRYVLLENGNGRFLYAGGLQGCLLDDLYKQSKDIFHRMKHILDKEGFPVNSIIRQWNYIERITEYHGKDQHYQMLNNARSEFYSLTDWANGYPAATGIGVDCGGVLIDFDAAVFKSDDCFATPIDNKLQVAAHAYSGSVLMEAGEMKTTPKFERAKSMTFGGNDIVYISGTAAIRGEESLTGVGIRKQLDITMENIAQLTGGAKNRLLRVYLKKREDYPAVKECLLPYEDSVYISYLLTDVCREELLIEIEGIAIK